MPTLWACTQILANSLPTINDECNESGFTSKIGDKCCPEGVSAVEGPYCVTGPVYECSDSDPSNGDLINCIDSGAECTEVTPTPTPTPTPIPDPCEDPDLPEYTYISPNIEIRCACTEKDIQYAGGGPIELASGIKNLSRSGKYIAKKIFEYLAEAFKKLGSDGYGNGTDKALYIGQQLRKYIVSKVTDGDIGKLSKEEIIELLEAIESVTKALQARIDSIKKYTNYPNGFPPGVTPRPPYRLISPNELKFVETLQSELATFESMLDDIRLHGPPSVGQPGYSFSDWLWGTEQLSLMGLLGILVDGAAPYGVPDPDLKQHDCSQANEVEANLKNKFPTGFTIPVLSSNWCSLTDQEKQDYIKEWTDRNINSELPPTCYATDGNNQTPLSDGVIVISPLPDPLRPDGPYVPSMDGPVLRIPPPPGLLPPHIHSPVNNKVVR